MLLMDLSAPQGPELPLDLSTPQMPVLNASTPQVPKPHLDHRLHNFENTHLKVHKRENFFGSDFEICTFS
jgi:hypothetical protein